MAEFTVDLVQGITVSGVEHRSAILRDATVDDVLAATTAAEKAVRVLLGYDENGHPIFEAQLLVSAFDAGINTLCRQIVSIGPLQGPFDRIMLNKISPIDLNVLQQAAVEREQLQVEALLKRGRSHSAKQDA